MFYWERDAVRDSASIEGPLRYCTRNPRHAPIPLRKSVGGRLPNSQEPVFRSRRNETIFIMKSLEGI